jgi:hypothetical protein
VLLNDPVCRYLIENDHYTVDAALAKDPEVPTHGFSRPQIRLALNKLVLAGVAELHKSSEWTWRVYLDGVVTLIKDLPGGLDTLDVLAHPVGWSVIARLTLGQTKRSALNMCGDTARISDQLKPLRFMKAIREEGKVVILLQPEDHRWVQDRLDELAGDIAMETFFFARHCATHQLERTKVGARYCWTEGFAEKRRGRENPTPQDTDVEPGWAL